MFENLAYYHLPTPARHQVGFQLVHVDKNLAVIREYRKLIVQRDSYIESMWYKIITCEAACIIVMHLKDAKCENIFSSSLHMHG